MMKHVIEILSIYVVLSLLTFTTDATASNVGSGGGLGGGQQVCGSPFWSTSLIIGMSGSSGRKMLQAADDDLLRQIASSEVLKEEGGAGVKIWKLLESHAELKTPDAVKESFPTKWKKGIVGKIKSDPSKLRAAWCKNVATCHFPSVDEVVTSVKSAVVFGLSFLPEVGPVLSAVVDFLWPEFPDKKKSTWDEIKDQVKQEISVQIDGLLFDLAKSSMDDIKNKYDGPTGYGMTLKNSTAAPERWAEMYNFITDNMCSKFVVGDGHELGLLPIFAQASNIQLLLLREGLHYAEKYPEVWKWNTTSQLTDGRTLMQVYKDVLLQHIIIYGSYVDAVYEHGLQAYQLPENPADAGGCLNAIEAWTGRNRYIRYMTINVMDYRTTWLYMHPTMFPYPGVNVVLERTIYSDPVGSPHEYVDAYRASDAGTPHVQCNNYLPFQYPTVNNSTNKNRVTFLRGTGKDFVRSLEIGFSDGQRKQLDGSKDLGETAFQLDASVVGFNPIYRIDYGVSYLVLGKDSEYVSTRNHIQYLDFALANGSAIYVGSGGAGKDTAPVPLAARFEKLQEVEVGSRDPPERIDPPYGSPYYQDHVDKGFIQFDGHIMSDAVFFGSVPYIDGVSVAVFSFRFDDSYPIPPFPSPPTPPPPPPSCLPKSIPMILRGEDWEMCTIKVNNCYQPHTRPDVPFRMTKVSDLQGEPLMCTCTCSECDRIHPC
ncbi:hypothetical protein CEUSTIGMA_g3921.t1 [Chlamydomonas eustigma]|uniref:Pesticidal crystal protein domain-containing protein n=1 Tax=Chlamydomonas eustigma TaxID=1157962 RepID=A0A250X093_9CHLO|nr:hypothetical protein CEUSTIGMA_g3921.t1 [Chlamydomonas eustigma]|eukprot:GAX76476.1 hypothetical protein CEUSTIGMA_g3921.t1 [Chlamydomonas eustigma]